MSSVQLSDKERPVREFTINGYTVVGKFNAQPNGGVIENVKQMLLASYTQRITSDTNIEKSIDANDNS